VWCAISHRGAAHVQSTWVSLDQNTGVVMQNGPRRMGLTRSTEHMEKGR
jgi:hypothetical protein